MTDTNDLVKRLRANHLDECYEAIARIEELEAKLAKAVRGLSLADEIERLEAECWRMKEDRDRAIEWRDKDTEELHATKDKLAKAVEALSLADANLTNLQPKIANGLVSKEWVPVFDGYIDPVIHAARAALTQKDTVHD